MYMRGQPRFGPLWNRFEVQFNEMWARRKKEEQEHCWQGAARSGLAGAPRAELMREAVHTLASEGRADRIGVWLEPDFSQAADPLAPACLRGIIWEWDAEERNARRLGAVVSRASCAAGVAQFGESVYQDLDDPAAGLANRPMIGPLVGVRHALWTPSAPKINCAACF